MGTALCWVATATSFEIAGRRIDSMVVNLLRLLMAMVSLSAFCAVTRGMALPLDANGHPWFWLGLSGIVGLSLAAVQLTQVSILMLPIAAVRGTERISLRAVLGTVLALAGAALLFVD